MKSSITDAMARADSIVDSQGMPIDAGIKDMVAILIALDIPTSGSCEGHNDHGLPYPWVDINVPYPADLEPSTQMISELKSANAPVRLKMEAYLGEFYTKRRSDSTLKLYLRNIGVYGAFRLHSVGLSRRPDLELTKQYRKEMSDFASFLKTKI